MVIFHATFFALICALATANEKLDPLSNEFIELINSKAKTWEAGRNFPEDMPLEYIKGLLGVLPNDNLNITLEKIQHDPALIASLPENFDPREKWPNCPSMNEIRDQGHCGSCWAISAVSAMTDRVCTYSNGAQNFHFSTQDLVSCGSDRDDGCQGGYSTAAWQYWETSGIVSGGPYHSGKGCWPYEMPPCTKTDCSILPAPNCVQTCQKDYKVDYQKDKHYGKQTYVIDDGEEHIMAELNKNGPVEVDFTVYEDFFHYKKGVYHHNSGEYAGLHAVKLMGWGVEDGTKYWLLANSWGTAWGDNGYFKFLRGENHCGIENKAVAGEPKLK